MEVIARTKCENGLSLDEIIAALQHIRENVEDARKLGIIFENDEYKTSWTIASIQVDYENQDVRFNGEE